MTPPNTTMPTLPTGGDLFAETTLQFAQDHALANSKAMVARLNLDLIARYQSAYTDYAANMQSGENVPAERRNPPVPPMAWELAPPDANGMVFYQQGSTQVCPQGPAVTMNAANPQPNVEPNVMMIGISLGGGWFQALKGDTFPNGKTTPPTISGDGVFGTFEKFGAPVGPGWYFRVS